MSSSTDVDKLIVAHNLVIYLVPYTYHAAIIESALKSKKQAVTTRYVTPAMRGLDCAVQEAGITC